MAVESIIHAATQIQQGIQGVATAYEFAPTSLAQLPCFVTYPGQGNRQWPRNPNVRTITHDLQMDLYVQKGGDLQAAERLLRPYIQRVFDTFDQNCQLQGTCTNAGVVDYKYGVLSYASVDYIGIKFTLRAEEINSIVYKA